jgi:hypothetical protein
MGYGEVGAESGLCERTDGFGLEGLGLGTKEDTGCGLVILGEFEGVEVVCCGLDPGGGGDCDRRVGDEA